MADPSVREKGVRKLDVRTNSGRRGGKDELPS